MAALPHWHRSNRWAIKIGYRHSKAGARVEAWHYFEGAQQSSPPSSVIVEAARLQEQWRTIKSEWPTVAPLLAELDPDADYTAGPVWFDRSMLSTPLAEADEIKQANAAAAAHVAKAAVGQLAEVKGQASEGQILAYLKSAGLLPKGLAVATRNVTIREAIAEYLDAEAKRVALKIGSRIDAGTFNTKRCNVLISVGLTTTTTEEVKQVTKVIDLDKPLVALDRKDVEAVAAHWFALPGEVKSRRTVANYLAGFKSFLTWADQQEAYGFTMPKGTADILYVNGKHEPNVTPVDYPKLKALLAAAPERVRMYALLALTCGFYQSDICELAAAEVSTVEGETYITGYRSKEDAEAKAGSKIKTTHWVAPEIARMMERQKAPANQWGLYFLTRYGQPLKVERIGGSTNNAVKSSWEKLTKGDDTAPTFKQLRKWGWNEIQKYGTDRVCTGEALAKRWAGQQGGGIGNHYRVEDYAPVIAAQRAWWRVLKTELRV